MHKKKKKEKRICLVFSNEPQNTINSNALVTDYFSDHCNKDSTMFHTLRRGRGNKKERGKEKISAANSLYMNLKIHKFQLSYQQGLLNFTRMKGKIE